LAESEPSDYLREVGGLRAPREGEREEFRFPVAASVFRRSSYHNLIAVRSRRWRDVFFEDRVVGPDDDTRDSCRVEAREDLA
jgi:hypothetical protein